MTGQPRLPGLRLTGGRGGQDPQPAAGPPKPGRIPPGPMQTAPGPGPDWLRVLARSTARRRP
jgi:hypothetical protein